MSKLIFAFAMVLLSIAFTADVPGLVEPDGFSRATIQELHDTLTPAICVLRYSMEITTPSGEVNRRAGYSLGLVVSPGGLIIAHGHLLLENRRPNNIKVTIGDDEDTKYNAVMLKKPDDINITFLRIETDEPLELPYVRFAPDAELRLGESVLLFGLLRESLDYARSLQMRRIGTIIEEPRKTYCLDASTGFGYVGGPVVNASGEVVGVLGFDLSASEGGDIYTRSGHPLVYQAALFQKYIDSPPSEDTTKVDAWLGVFTQPLTDKLAEYWGLRQEGGIVVSDVLPGSPADRSGFRSGDVIVNFDGHVVTAKQDQDVMAFTMMVRESPLEEPLSVEFFRDGEAMEIRLTLLPKPKSRQDALEFEDDVFGLTVRELTTDARILMNLPADVDGLIVRRVKSGSPAALAGLRPGFVVMAVGDRPIRSIEDYTGAIEEETKRKPREIRVFCRVGANTAFFRVQPRWPE